MERAVYMKGFFGYIFSNSSTCNSRFAPARDILYYPFQPTQGLPKQSLPVLSGLQLEDLSVGSRPQVQGFGV